MFWTLLLLLATDHLTQPLFTTMKKILGKVCRLYCLSMVCAARTFSSPANWLPKTRAAVCAEKHVYSHCLASSVLTWTSSSSTGPALRSSSLEMLAINPTDWGAGLIWNSFAKKIEFHPHLVQSDLLQWCQKQGIHFQAYSSLGTSDKNNKLLTDPTVQAVAKGMNKTAAQVLLRWAIQQDVGVLPKSTNPAHIKENADVFSFELSDKDMQTLSRLSTSTHYCWDPSAVA